MTTTLTPDLEAFVRDEVAAGSHPDEVDVIRAALAPGLADLAAGRFAQGGVMDSAARAAAE